MRILFALMIFCIHSFSLYSAPLFKLYKFNENNILNYAISVENGGKQKVLPICGCQTILDIKDLFDIPRTSSIDILSDGIVTGNLSCQQGPRIPCVASPPSAKAVVSPVDLTLYRDLDVVQYVLSIGGEILLIPVDCDGLAKSFSISTLPSQIMNASMKKKKLNGISLSCGEGLLDSVRSSVQTKTQSLWKLYLYEPLDKSKAFFIAVNRYGNKKQLFPISKINGENISSFSQKNMLSEAEYQLQQLFEVQKTQYIVDLDELFDRNLVETLPHSIFWDITLSGMGARKAPFAPFILKNSDEELLDLDEGNKEFLTNLSIYKTLNSKDHSLDFVVAKGSEIFAFFDTHLESLLRHFDIPVVTEVDFTKISSFLEREVAEDVTSLKFYGELPHVGVCETSFSAGSFLETSLFNKKRISSCRDSDHILRVTLSGDVSINHPIKLSPELGFDEIVITRMDGDNDLSVRPKMRVTMNVNRVGEESAAIITQNMKRVELSNIEFTSESNNLYELTYIVARESYIQGNNIVFQINTGKTDLIWDIAAKDHSIVSLEKCVLMARKINLYLDNSIGVSKNSELIESEALGVSATSSSFFMIDGKTYSKNALGFQRKSKGFCRGCMFNAKKEIPGESSATILKEGSSVNMFGCKSMGFDYCCDFRTPGDCTYSIMYPTNDVKKLYKGKV